MDKPRWTICPDMQFGSSALRRVFNHGVEELNRTWGLSLVNVYLCRSPYVGFDHTIKKP